MERTKRPFTTAAMFIVIGLIVGLVISSNSGFNLKAYSAEPKISKDAIDILTKTGQAMAEVVAAVKPAVVNISTSHTIKTTGMSTPFLNDPFFNRFFGEEFGNMRRPREYKQSSLGSGVIVDKDGYILTNYHVIKDADEIKVKLSDNREFKGKVIGKDSRTDIAVIKIASDHLPTLVIGDSDKLKVGETVIAIGNPFGLNQTVTSGIVSATGRANMGIADYEDFIQTDAAINPGNSGGALVNVRGELVGINTAIFSTSGGYQGIGFAIPSSMANNVMENLIKNGKVLRGWLGVSIQPITPELSKQFNLKDQKGVLVGDVTEDSPAERAGIKRGDVITGYNGKEVGDPVTLKNMVANTPPNTKVVLRIVHDGKIETIKVTVAELSAEMQKMQGKFDNVLKGIQVQNITQDIRSGLRLSKQVNGVIITDIDEGSPAGSVLTRNDVIMEVNREGINNLKDFEMAASRIRSGQNVLLLIYRDGATFYVTLSGQ